ncbi:MAG TPA: purine-nucleoside phosphorylase [Bryobacteraceae bacterium]|nr:purine-nucleoside phosphorylase [Bryobacteraceae bacterium]
MYLQTRKFLQSRLPGAPAVGVVLGSGLGDFADELQDRIEISSSEIPGWPRSTAVGHAGKFVFGYVDGVPVAVLAGRVHLYEGYSPARVTYGMRALKLLGVKSMILTNAAGGINLGYAQGALVLLSDHINLQGVNPLAGANEEEFGPRFPDMSDAYSIRLRGIARQCAQELGIELGEGVYAAMLGPSYETPAEIRFLRTIGADLVGMSTVAETIVCNHMGIEVLAISCVTNMAAGILPQKINHEEVLETGRAVRDKFVRLLRGVIPRMEAARESVA